MAKKKKTQNSGNGQGNKGKTGILIGFAGVALVLMIAYLAQQPVKVSHGAGSAHMAVAASADPNETYAERADRLGLVETRPLMSPQNFNGNVAQIYEWAQEIPQAFDALYCYCKCKENPRFKHKTLLTCYVDDHAANCGVCLKEGTMAWELTQKGKTPQEIREIVDKTYANIEHKHG